MSFSRMQKIFSAALFLVMLTVCIVPVYAQSSNVTITYRGPGGYYVGDLIIFDGKNTASNMTVVKITGPGLPAEGVPPFNLTDVAGTGNTAEVDPTGTWAFYWDSSRTVGIDNLYTARYTITAYDLNNPDIKAVTSVMLKKPEFYLTISPNPATSDQYVQLNGDVETGESTVEINVLDSSGNKVHTFTSPISSGGYFSFGFHVDMAPGDYTVTVSSPSMSKTLSKTLIVAAPATSTATVSETSGTTVAATPSASMTANPSGAQPTVSATGTPGSSSGTGGSLVISSKPAGATVYLDSVSVGKTPLTLNAITPGVHTVEIKSPGYLTCSLDVTVTADKTTEISPELVMSPSGLPLSPITIIAACVGAIGLLWASRQRKH